MLALEPLEDGERGATVNTASAAAEDGEIGQAAYSASKGGILGITLRIARDLMDDGIRIKTILPGIFNTPLMMGVPEPVRDALGASVPVPKRFGRQDEYASLALELCRNCYCNGEDLRLDGAIRTPPNKWRVSRGGAPPVAPERFVPADHSDGRAAAAEASRRETGVPKAAETAARSAWAGSTW